MNELQVFTYEGADVRTVDREGAIWWVLKDVCGVFGESNHKRVKQRLDVDEVGYTTVTHPQNPEKTLEMSIINESGLYSALFVMQPAKARGVSEEYIAERELKLKKFKRWVTHEVLPSIRKTGSYSANGFSNAERLKAASVISKTTRHNLPYVLRMLGMNIKTPGQTKDMTYDLNDDLTDFLNSLDIIGKPTNDIYKLYCAEVKNPLHHVAFSKEVIRRLGIKIIDKKINGVKRRIFVEG
jgi:prophage antirepressor-like protein